ncbi:MAG TPA: YbaN family protein [Methylophilaceae bacterium]|nr:YbaN family protein [Methylophilaceae bacterium]
MLTQIRKLLWRIVAAIALLLGVIGLFLPIVPTVPFVLLAAWASSKGWPQLEQYLLSHRYCGPQIRAWREHGAIARRAKYMAAIMIGGSIALLWLMPLRLALQVGISVIMVAVIIWVWTRPDAI